MVRFLSLIIAVVFLLSNSAIGFSQTPTDSPVYIVQSGDTLGIIAQRFGVPVNDLIQANALANPNAISVGMKLKIPGLVGIRGTLITQTVPLGESFQSLSIRFQVPQTILSRLNRITSPFELYAGSSLVLPQDSSKGSLQARTLLSQGESPLEASARLSANYWTTLFENQRGQGDLLLAGEMIFSQKAETQTEINSISPLIEKIQINPLPVTQGGTVVIRVNTTQPVEFTGKLAGRELHFFPEKNNQYVALQGIYALANPGLTPVNITGTSKSGLSFSYDTTVVLKSGLFPNDPSLVVDPKTIDPEVTKPEEDQIAAIIKPATPVKLWTKKFRVPVDEPVCYKSTFGNRRSYNGGPYNSFHGGTDFGVCANLNIYAPADGVVVFAGPLSVRGNATIIDHGWGVYSGYWHQKEIKVKVGDQIKAGTVIGLIGATGRVTGPHLHWEMMVNGIQVEPVDWLNQTYP